MNLVRMQDTHLVAKLLQGQQGYIMLWERNQPNILASECVVFR